MIEVFTTNVNTHAEAQVVLYTLHQNIHAININFDLEDCDKILRLEAESINNNLVINTVNKLGFKCEVLLD